MIRLSTLSSKVLGAALAVVFLSQTAQTASASWWGMTYGGHQPWWNVFAHRNHHMSAEEKRLQRFWRDYYNALHRYYDHLENIDWVAYYKNHGYQINGGCGMGMGMGMGCGPRPVQFAPVVVNPGMNWGIPSGAGCAPPTGPLSPAGGFGPYGAGPGMPMPIMPAGYMGQ